jgi:uncharacterized protein Veg
MAGSIQCIRDNLRRHKGAAVCYRAANGRRKMEERQGVIVEVYPALFTMYVEAQHTTVSFSYADLLTRDVEIELLPDHEKIL